MTELRQEQRELGRDEVAAALQKILVESLGVPEAEAKEIGPTSLDVSEALA